MRNVSQLPPDLLECLAIWAWRALAPKSTLHLPAPPPSFPFLQSSTLPSSPARCSLQGRPYSTRCGLRSSRTQRHVCSRMGALTYSTSSPKTISDTTTEPPSNTTPHATNPTRNSEQEPRPPYTFLTGYALFAKRTPRPFPPPFLSPPSGSFSDPLSTHDRARPKLVNGDLIRGKTNGDDAVYASPRFICANDGVGAWSTRPRGHAGLWSRLILHFWACAIDEDVSRQRKEGGCFREPHPTAYLQRAYEETVRVTGESDWQGTTTACGALLHWKKADTNERHGREEAEERGSTVMKNGTAVVPLLYVTQLGDSQVMVVRPSEKKFIFKTKEQWHWFDCPKQLGTNSPDTPATDAVIDEVPIREGDVVLAMSDGVIDNLWSHEIVECVSDSVARWAAGEGRIGRKEADITDGGMAFVAHELVDRAKQIALDPFAESPFMEHAIEEGLPSTGGKLDDISVVAALCTRNA